MSTPKTEPNRHVVRRRSAGPRVIANLLLMVLLGLCAVLGCGLALALPKRTPELIGAGESRLLFPQKLALSLYLAANADALNALGDDVSEVDFTVVVGANANTVANDLLTLGLIQDTRLLRYYMRYNGLDNRIDAGNFVLTRAMSVRQIAEALTRALPSDYSVRMWEGWRMEQMAEAFAVYPNLRINGDEFLQRARNGEGWRLRFAFLLGLPGNSSLEGYLFPDTYNFSSETDAESALRTMLENFEKQLTPAMLDGFARQNLTLHQAVTLASIIEREAVVSEERPIIAQVFLNRLTLGMTLDADPTTQYSLGKSGNWWPQLNFDPRTVQSEYNTYLVRGLPPAPIANPSLASLQAVAAPSGDSYLYFRATCAKDGGRHAFANTLEEHIANGCE